MGLIGIWFNHVTIPHKNVLFDVYFGFPESRDATNIIYWIKRYLNHRCVSRLFRVTIRICTDWLVLCLFLMQCKYWLWVIGILVFMMYVLIQIHFRNYSLYKTSLTGPDVIFLGVWTLYVKASVVWWYIAMAKMIDLCKDK